MSDVLVLMSTYNGENYLKEQIDSIFSQDCDEKIILFVRDDGSSDGTLAILREYPRIENRELRWFQGENVGPQRSFLELMRLASDAQYYFFADQDDLWDSAKIRSAVEKMTEVDGVCAYCSNYRLADKDLHIIKNKVIEKTPKFSPLSIIFYNQIPGCTMGFNADLMKMWKEMHIDNVMMHDSAVLSFASIVGQVVYDSEARIYHRIHAENVVGSGHKKIIPHKWIKEKISLMINKEDYDLSYMAEEFLRVMEIHKISSIYKKDMELLRDYKKKFTNVFWLLKHEDSKGMAWDRTTLSIRSKILLRLF